MAGNCLINLTNLGIIGQGVYESQGGLGEVSARTVGNQRRCSFDQAVVWEIFHMLRIFGDKKSEHLCEILAPVNTFFILFHWSSH